MMKRARNPLTPRALVAVLLWLMSWSSTLGQEPEQAQKIHGQPVGWAIEKENAESLIPIAADSALREQPQSEAGILAILPGGTLPLLEAHETWVKIRYGELEGWVDLEALRSRPARGKEPPPQEPRWDPGEIEPSGEIGTYTLWGTPKDPADLGYLDRVAREHLRVYGERYGLVSETPVEGDVKLVSQRQEFVSFYQDESQSNIDVQGNVYYKEPALLVIYTGRSQRRQLASTLLHALTHLLNNHFLNNSGKPGAKLPAWLDEGLAEDLTFATCDRKGNLRAEPLGPGNLRFGRKLLTLLFRISYAVETERAPPLPELVDMDRETFFSGDREFHYSLSALFIRYILNEPQLAERFREFLRLVADGAAASSANLATRLDRTWPELESGFRAWLIRQRARFPR